MGPKERGTIGITSPGNDRGHLEGRRHSGSGMSALVSLCVLALVQIANAQCEPPIPDFEAAIDYQAWHESCVRGPYNEKQNAAPIYLTALGASDGKALVSTDALGFVGPLNQYLASQPQRRGLGRTRGVEREWGIRSKLSGLRMQTCLRSRRGLHHCARPEARPAPFRLAARGARPWAERPV